VALNLELRLPVTCKMASALERSDAGARGRDGVARDRFYGRAIGCPRSMTF
jgi:hypothetical protein